MLRLWSEGPHKFCLSQVQIREFVCLCEEVIQAECTCLLQESIIEGSAVEDENIEGYSSLSHTNRVSFPVFVLLLNCKVSFTWASVQ